MTRSLLLAACLVAPVPLRAGEVPADVSASADWRKAGLPDGAKAALAADGYRFEDDGRVLDPETKEPLSSDELGEAVTRLGLSTQRLALERLRLILSKDKLEAADMTAIRSLKGNLPETVAKAVDASASAADLRKLADRDLARISSYFDASRTLGDRRDAAQPVRADGSGRRVSLPYFNESERRAGESLGAAAEKAISKDAFGRTVLARLNDQDGKPAIPPVVIADLDGGNVAAYDYRRRALVMDRTRLLMSVTEDAAPKDRAALSKTLSSRQALVDHIARHPETAASFADKNDALLVHELTHAWQDRRDPVMREMARGNLPQAMLIEYEIEAWTTKNLYIHSRLKQDPRARIDLFELEDYRKMVAKHDEWANGIKMRYGTDIASAMDIPTATAIQRRRIEMARRRSATSADDQTAKSLDLAALTRAGRELQAAEESQRARLEELKTVDSAAAAEESSSVLAAHYLASAISAPNDIEFTVRIQKAEDFAVMSGDKTLIEKVRSLKGRSR